MPACVRAPFFCVPGGCGPGEAPLHRHGLRRGAGHHLPAEAVPRVQGPEKTRAGGLESSGGRDF